GNSPGMAVVGTTGQGRWQFSRDGGRSWVDVGTVSPAQALLLAGSYRLRFVPVANWRGVAELSYRAWDQTSNRPGDKVGWRGPGRVGGAAAFRALVRTTQLRVGGAWVSAASAPPVVSLALRVSSVLARSGQPVTAGQGIAVVAAGGAVRWEYSLDGQNWY